MRGIYSLKLAAKVIDFLTESGFDPVYGARPLKRGISKGTGKQHWQRAFLSGKIKKRTNKVPRKSGKMEKFSF
jgi:ATPases with chaperone activity, ATP-binding subunit